MKQLVNFAKPVAIIAAAIITTFTQPVLAAGHKPHHLAVATTTESSFSIELNKQGSSDAIRLTIKNPGKKNLSVILNAPDGTTVDNFFTGKRLCQMDKLYNFTGADAGVYTIEVSDGAEKITKQIKLERITVDPVTLTVQ
jgi:hypothetical protein